MKRRLLCIGICCALSACSNQPVETLAQLPAAALPEEPAIEIPQVDIASLQQSYRQALDTATDVQTRRLIALRLADLEMERLENLQAEQPETAVSYASAVRQYRELAEQSPADDYVLYRLARAQALEGDAPGSLQSLQQLAVESPQSPFMTETLFRRGEAAFNRGDYASAERDFSAVLSYSDTPFAENARYMLGWSQFKSTHYRAANHSFLQLLDELQFASAAGELTQGRQNLAQDTLRALALGFNQLGGAESIESFNPDGRSRAYQHQLYLALGDWYAESERYRDSAASYMAYVKNYPHGDEAPELQVRAIEILERGDFPSEVLPAKREFIQRYGIRGEYWQQADAAQREKLSAWLRPWLAELASYEHARAQSLQSRPADARAAYLAAAALYGEFTQTFPGDERTPQQLFLMAECFEQAGEFDLAWDAYRRVAWEYADETRGAEAGYAAVLNAEKMQRQFPAGEQAELWRERQTETGLKFADSWPRDPRALPVLLDTAGNLFAREDYPRAIAAAQTAAQWQPPPDTAQRRNLNLILGHSQFELGDYAAAEAAYARILEDSPGDTQTRERLQTAVFKQAETLLAAGPGEAGIQQLLRVRDSGRTEIAASAQYDAINHLLTLEHWTEAQEEIADYRAHYPQHPLTPTLAAKAVLIYQALSLPALAAGELLQLAEVDPDSEVRRQSLYLAAEYYREAGERERAIAALRSYSERWREPREQNLEAQYQLAQLYAEAGHHRERNLHLNALAQNPGESPRARYLGAYAQHALAEQSYEAFAQIPLRLPLDASLRQKRRAMDATVADYRKLLEFNIAEFTTAANFRLAEVYHQLSRDLIESQRPRGLDELELEQYEILLEEQAFPFEERAIELHQANVARAAEGIYDDWVKRSFDSLAQLLPARYRKREEVAGPMRSLIPKPVGSERLGTGAEKSEENL